MIHFLIYGLRFLGIDTCPILLVDNNLVQVYLYDFN